MKIRIAVTIPFPARANPSDYLQSDYRIVSLPGGGTIPVTKYLPGTAGTDWQMYWDTGADSGYSGSYFAGGVFSFAPGRAFWLIKMTNFVVDDSVVAASVDSAGTAAVPLHPGWNLIGNPFPDSVKWSAVASMNPPLGSKLYTWTGNWQESTVLLPYVGYMFENPDSLASLGIPSPGGGLSKVAAGEDPASWSMRIDLHAAGSIEQVSMLGVSPLAEAFRRRSSTVPSGIT